jgi:acetyl-CoA carboxylase carboxyl transferase subunit alpha
MQPLDFEKPIVELEAKIEELRIYGAEKKVNLGPDIKKCEKKLEQLRQEIYANLTDWQRVQIARHPARPYMLDYISMIASEFLELHGDRLFADDQALLGGLAQINDTKIMIIGHQKGRDVKENIRRNFGCAHPEGYRKALRLMQIAAKFRIPIVTLIDTPGAYPGIGAEERGQAQAIATNLRDMMLLATPVVAVVIGEGGSGGAIGIGVADRVFMLQNAYYSVISPEGCASILWRNSVRAPDAANALKLTAEHLLKLGIIDDVIPEPSGGAHHDPQFVATNLSKLVLKAIKELSAIPAPELMEARYAKFRRLGVFLEPSQEPAVAA